MTSRERFEEWQSKVIEVWGLMPVAWQAWQAAEHQALERAAKRAEEKSMNCHTLGNAEEFRELAACIRAMMQDEAIGKEANHNRLSKRRQSE